MIIAGIDEAGLGPRLGPLVTAVAAFRAHCEARGLEHYWTVLDRHDLRPREFGDPSQDETAAVLGRTRRDVTNWLARARKVLRRFAEQDGNSD